MATSLEYSPASSPQFTADDELRHLLEVLHSSGTLRFLIGLFGRLGAVSDVALDAANTEAGRNILGALLFLGKSLAELPAEDLTAVTRGLENGFKAAEHVAQQEPRSLLGLMQLAREPETRRAFEVLLTIANRVGSQLGHSG